MFDLFNLNEMRVKFFQNLEPFIISGQFKKEIIPEKIFSEFLDNFEANQGMHTK